MKADGPVPVQIKGTRDGFILVPAPAMPFVNIVAYLSQKLSDSRHFLQRSRMTLDWRNRPFDADEIRTLRELLAAEADIEVREVVLGSDLERVFHWASQQLGVRVTVPALPVPEPVPVIVRMTCRSGMRVQSDADCVVLGDVNPGAEIVAVGDIIVLGSLRGIAHAGAGGNRAAKIWAVTIEPNQIRIADLVAVPPGEPRKRSGRFEVAEVRGEAIEVTTL
jgi:septum site-determining protein MinC